jgi:DnaK suppressor protein
MNAKQLADIRQRLSAEYQGLVKSIGRSRLEAEQITVEKTEDESDLATLNQERELLFNLHESDFVRLRSIQEAMKAVDRGQYGECVRCGEDINEKRLEAVPWARMCIRCQEETEADRVSSSMVLATSREAEMEL